MISLEQAQLIADTQNASTAEGKGIEAAIKAAAQLGGYSASYTFPVDFSSANLKDNIELQGMSFTVSTAQTLGVRATFTGQAAGMTTDVTITAVNTGAAGNSISLAFDGIITVAAGLAVWNAANPLNTASLAAGVGTQIPDAAETIDLATGVTAVAEIIAIDFGPQA